MSRALLVVFNSLLLLATAGCGGGPADPPPADTGARNAAVAFFEALGRKDWTQAYSALDPKGWTEAEFIRRAMKYRTNLGFEAVTVHVRACEERGGEATAHVVLTGKGHGRHSYRETVFLRQQDGAWRVVLPANFGG